VFKIFSMGYSMGSGLKALNEGSKVKYFLTKNDDRFLNFVKKYMDGWGIEYELKNKIDKDDVDDYDIFIVDDVGFNDKVPDEVRNLKYTIVGNAYADRLEMDRDFMMEESRKMGVNVGQYEEFDSLSEGIEFLKRERGQWVIKLSGDEGEIYKWTTYVAKDENSDDLIGFMNFLAKFFKKDNIKYILQEKFNGVEVALTEVANRYILNFEYKNFMKGSNLKTGEMGTLIKSIDRNNEIVKKSKIDDVLAFVEEKGGKYSSYFDMNMIVNEDGAHLLEYTSRFGYPISDIIAGATNNVSELWYGIAKGGINNMPNGWIVGIVVNTPPSPYEFSEKEMEKLGNIVVYDDAFLKMPNGINVGIWKDGDIFRTSTFGYTYLVVGIGKNIEEANKIAAERAKNVNIPLSFWRDDIGLPDIPNVKKLVEMGYLNGDEVEVK